MRNEQCPVKFRTSKKCWKNCPVKTAFAHGAPAEQVQTVIRKFGCRPEGVASARPNK